LKDTPKCTYGGPTVDFFNNPDVRKKLHIPDNIPEWTFCSDQISVATGGYNP